MQIDGEDLLRAFYELFHSWFCDSREKALFSIGFTGNMKDIFT